jgi:hypothetical protein
MALLSSKLMKKYGHEMLIGGATTLNRSVKKKASISKINETIGFNLFGES